MRLLLIVMAVLFAGFAAVGAQMFFKNRKTPANLGVKNGRLAPMPGSPNAVSSQTDVKDKIVAPFPFKEENLAASKAAVKKILKRYGGIEIKTETDDYIHAVSTTGTMKFRDDLEFYFDARDKVVHFRSASRVGYSDMGLNKQRYRSLVDLYRKV